MDEGRSYSAWAVSSALHGALLLFLILGFAAAPKFEDSQEAIPVDVVTDAQLNQIMNGEKDAKPAPEPPPAPRTEPAPPSPPEPPPDVRAAERPTPPEPTPPPRPEPPPPPKPETAPPPKQADLPRPPERPPEKPKPDLIARAVERDKTEAKPRAYDPDAIAKLIAPRPPPASGAGAPTSTPVAIPQGLPHHDAPRMSVSMSSALDAWLTESYLNCWTPPPSLPEGDVYVAEIKVVFNPDGSLSARPILLNPPNDPAWRALAESAMRAVRKCDPLRVPPEYAPYFEQWKVETIHFDPREAQG